MSRLKVPEAFRASMNWLHTWAGIAVSCLLFVIFWMGSLSVFDREIDQWMKPEMRIKAPSEPFQFGPVFDHLRAGDGKGATLISILAPSERDPFGLFVYVMPNGDVERGLFDPRTNKRVEVTESYAGTEFFYPFHYSLHIPQNIGYWVVGFSAMAMLVLIVSGIFIHRRLVKDFFTFRPNKSLRRSTLDLHNLSSLVALPLHILFPLTGLMIFFSIYFPWSSYVVFDGDNALMREAAYGRAIVEPSGRPAPANIDLDRLVGEVEAAWAMRSSGTSPRADTINVHLANDENVYFRLRETFPSRAVSLNRNTTTISVSNGEILVDVDNGPAKSAYAWLAGAHYIQFDNWALRWLYFAGGLLGSVMIASGLMFWIQARIRKGVIEPRSVRVVRTLTIGSVTGIIVASAAFLIANRLLPREAALAGFGRSDLEVWAFFIVWVLTFAHAAVRDKRAWRDQALAIAALALTAVGLNWLTTGDHIARTVNEGLWSVAGMDLVLIAGALTACWFAWRLVKTERIEAQKRMPSVRSEQEKMAAE